MEPEKVSSDWFHPSIRHPDSLWKSRSSPLRSERRKTKIEGRENIKACTFLPARLHPRRFSQNDGTSQIIPVLAAPYIAFSHALTNSFSLPAYSQHTCFSSISFVLYSCSCTFVPCMLVPCPSIPCKYSGHLWKKRKKSGSFDEH
jgi:hypothetical protein